MVWEEIQDSEDLKQENEDIRLKHPDFKPVRTVRLSLYKKDLSTQKGLASAGDSFLGYVIIRQIDNPKKTWIFESVLKPNQPIDNFIIKGDQEWICSIGGCDFRVKGYLYAQQNGITNVCAHVALRSAVHRFRQDDMTYREMNNFIGVDHVNKKVGDKSGLSTQDMIKVLESAGARCMAVDYTTSGGDKDKIPFQKILYGSIESGFPAIVVFQMADEPSICHAVPVFGHTFDKDAWVYRAEASYFRVGPQTLYIPSESWVSTYIAHDDNWGSNFRIPRGYLHTRRYCDQITSDAKNCLMDIGCVVYVIGTRPQEVEMDPLQAEAIGVDYLFSMLPKLPDLEHAWNRRLLEYSNNNQLVLRPILVKCRDYKKHLKKIRDWDKNKSKVSIGIDDDWWLWVVELSVPELFPANQRKVGEVVLRAEHKPTCFRDFKNLLFARIPGFFALYVGGGAENPSYEFIPSDLKSHVELYGCEENR
ncbi:MAG: hypothetical protein ABSG97_05960 [Sedimentisphaerales bacterium]|jgi:hypothetical protein